MSKPNNNKAARGKNRKAGNAPKLTAEQERTLLAKQLRLKPRTKAFVDELLNNKSMTQAEAYMNTHKTQSKKNAGIQASKLLSKDSVNIYRDSAVQKAKARIVSLVDSSNESIALKASDSILDRQLGKSIQKTENLTRTIDVRLDLSGTRIGSHYIKADIQPVLTENE
jgi:hypothetical protein